MGVSVAQDLNICLERFSFADFMARLPFHSRSPFYSLTSYLLL